jgi:hypothetical protein
MWSTVCIIACCCKCKFQVVLLTTNLTMCVVQHCNIVCIEISCYSTCGVFVQDISDTVFRPDLLVTCLVLQFFFQVLIVCTLHYIKEEMIVDFSSLRFLVFSIRQRSEGSLSNNV